jgi:FMN reductase
LTSRDRNLKVVGIGGTLREGSTSLGALRRALAASGEAGADVELLDLNELKLPMYEPRKSLDEYGDFVQFLGKEDHPYFDGKVAGLITTAAGEQAAANANAAMVHVVHALRGIVAPLMVGVTKAWQRTDDSGEITDENYGRRLDNLGWLVVDLAQKVGTEESRRPAEPVGAVA